VKQSIFSGCDAATSGECLEQPASIKTGNMNVKNEVKSFTYLNLTNAFQESCTPRRLARRLPEHQLDKASIITVFLSKAKVQGRPSTGSSKSTGDCLTPEALVSLIVAVRWTLPLGKTRGAMVQTLPSAKIRVIGLPSDTSITPKSLFFGKAAVDSCLEQPTSVNTANMKVKNEA
jgi:hypothetical protein